MPFIEQSVNCFYENGKFDWIVCSSMIAAHELTGEVACSHWSLRVSWQESLRVHTDCCAWVGRRVCVFILIVTRVDRRVCVFTLIAAHEFTGQFACSYWLLRMSWQESLRVHTDCYAWADRRVCVFTLIVMRELTGEFACSHWLLRVSWQESLPVHTDCYAWADRRVCVFTLIVTCELTGEFSCASISQTFLLSDPLWLRKITTDPHILADVNTECPDDRYPKLKMYMCELILDSYEYIPIA
jgi:hypothetical protein